MLNKYAELLRAEAERDAAQENVTALLSEIRLLKGELAGYKLAFNACGPFPRLFAKLCGNLGTLARFYRTGSYFK